MKTSRRALEWAIAVWVLCVALMLPVALSANATVALVASQQTTAEVLNGLMAGEDPALSLAEPSTSSTGWLTGPPFDVPAAALLVNTPGTDDTTLYRRIDPMRGGLDTVIVVYPQSLWPIISGNSGQWLPIFAPTYDQSVAVAVAHTLATMQGLQDASDKPYVVYSGYSQGADAVGEAAEQGYARGLLDPASTQVVLVSDPRSPWGIKQWARDNCLVSIVFSLVGATPDGARNPADTGDELPVTSVIIDGDPVANFQWVWYRPITSLIVDAAGALAVHGLMGPENYSNLDQIEDKEFLYSRDGRTTYVVYHAQHPLTQLTQMVIGIVGIRLSETEVQQLDDFNNWFYPLQQPSPERAAPAAPVTPTSPAPVSADDATSTTAAATSLAAPENISAHSSRQQPGPEAAAPETTTAPAPAGTDDAISVTPSLPEDLDMASDVPPTDTVDPADTADDTTSPEEVTGPADDEDVSPGSDLPKTSTTQQSSDDAVTNETHSPADDSAKTDDSTPGSTNVKPGGGSVQQGSQESSASAPDQAAA